MPSANGRRHDRRRPRHHLHHRLHHRRPGDLSVIYRIYGSRHRLHANIGWAGVFLLVLLFAMNHRYGWFTR